MLCMPIFDHELGAINYGPCVSDLLAAPFKNLDPKTYHSVHAAQRSLRIMPGGY
jgi:hypothetical protein